MGFRYALCLGLAVAGCGAQPTSTQMPGEGASRDRPDAAVASAPSASASAAAVSPAPAPSGSASAPTAATSTKKGDTAKAPAPKIKPKPPADPAPATIATAKAHSDGRHYALDVKAPGALAAGGRGELEVVLVAKDGYHINDEYPYKLKTASLPAGVVDFESAELPRASGVYTATQARFVARFVAAHAGSAKVGGTMSLSVCTAKECIVEKVELEVPVVVQ